MDMDIVEHLREIAGRLREAVIRKHMSRKFCDAMTMKPIKPEMMKGRFSRDVRHGIPEKPVRRSREGRDRQWAKANDDAPPNQKWSLTVNRKLTDIRKASRSQATLDGVDK